MDDKQRSVDNHDGHAAREGSAAFPTARRATGASPGDAPLTLTGVPTVVGEKAGEPDLGQVDRYVLRRCLGQGGFGAVYLAEDMEAQITVALKTLPGQIASNPGEMQGMRENFALVQRLHHPHIAALQHLHRIDVVDAAAKEALRVYSGDYLLVMEYVAGATLSDWRCLFPGRRVPLVQSLRLCSQIASALDYAHAEKIVHRDIKPANIMVMGGPDSDALVKVLDFGLAAEIRSSLSRVSQEKGRSSGTPPYMSPEQWSGQPQGASSDQYSLAALFYELVSGAVPFASAFETDSWDVKYNAATRLLPQPLSELTKRQNTALLRAMAKNPAERFASCGDFIVALGGERLSRAHAASSAGAERRGFVISMRVAAVLLLLLAVAIGGGYSWRRYGHVRHRQASERAEQSRREIKQAVLDEAAQARITLLAASTRMALSAGKLDEAGERLAELTELVGAESDVVTDLRRIYESQAGERETNIRYSQASVERDKVVAFDPGQGFAARLDALETTWREAEAARQGRAWGQALTAYDQVRAECDHLQTLAAARQQAATGRDQADRARRAAVAVKAVEDAAELMRAADATAAQAVAAFAAGDFSAAEKSWSVAAVSYADAARRAQVVQDYQQAKAAFEQAVASEQELLQQHGGERWRDVLGQLLRSGAADGADLVAGAAAYRAAQEALLGAISEAQGRQREAHIEAAATMFRERLAAATAAKDRSDWQAALAVLQAALPTEPFAGVYAAEPLQELMQQLVILEKGVRASQRKAQVGVHLSAARTAAATGDWLAVAAAADKALALDAGNSEAHELWKMVKIHQLRVPDGFLPVPGTVPEPYTQTGWAQAIIHEKSGIEMLYIPAGSFMMGSAEKEHGRLTCEGPQHRVRILHGFYLGKTEVTQAQWVKVMGANKNPSHFKQVGANAPVETVTWDACQAFCQAAAAGLRLPMEAEWEYACRAGTTTAFHYGASLVAAMANFDGNYPYGDGQKGDYRQTTIAVGHFKPNAWGLYDMHGNVWEWCQDKFASYPAASVTLISPAGASGRVTGDGAYRVLRGGCWSRSAASCRSAYRGGNEPGDCNGGSGFRVARSAPPVL